MVSYLEDVEGFVFEIKEEHYNLIGRVISQFSRLEYSLTQCISEEFGIGAAHTQIMLGRMGTKGKFDKLIKFHNHNGESEKEKAFLELQKRSEKLTAPRNIITHNPLVGHLPKPKHQTLLCFASDKYLTNKDRKKKQQNGEKYDEADYGKIIAYSELDLDECASSLHVLASSVFDLMK